MTGPGLDVAALQRLRAGRHDESLLHRRIADHLSSHDGYLAFSAGKDSLAALHLTVAVEPNVPVVFFDSGLEYPETYQYLADLAQRWQLDLEVIAARPTALEILAGGGAWNHGAPVPAAPIPDLRTATITQPAAQAHDTYGPGELWGVRAEESQGRRALYSRALTVEVQNGCASCCSSPPARRTRHGGIIRRRDGTTAYGPVWDWSTAEVWAYLQRRRLPINPVYDKLRRLGAPHHALRLSQMLDGAHLESGRATWLRRGWPAIFEDLCDLLPRLREYV